MAARGTEWHSWQPPALLIPSRLPEFQMKRRLCGLKCDNEISGVIRDVTLCSIYIPPEKRGDRTEMENLYAHFGDEIQQALVETTYLVACGDFNAHIGTMDEIMGTHYDILAAYPQLVKKRVTQCTQTNRAGRLLTLRPTWNVY